MARLKLKIKDQPPTFIIRGKVRREKKKEMNQLKSFIKNFWYCEDVGRVYGGGLTDEECNTIIKQTNNKIKTLENQLSETK